MLARTVNMDGLLESLSERVLERIIHNDSERA